METLNQQQHHHRDHELTKENRETQNRTSHFGMKRRPKHWSSGTTDSKGGDRATSGGKGKGFKKLAHLLRSPISSLSQTSGRRNDDDDNSHGNTDNDSIQEPEFLSDEEVETKEESDNSAGKASCNHRECQGRLTCKRVRDEEYQEIRLFLDLVAEDVESMVVKMEIGHRDEFCGSDLPKISFNDYIYRLVRYMNVWYHERPSLRGVGVRALIMSLVYVSRIGLDLNEYNVHRLFLTSMLIAAKFTEDAPISNQYWSKVGGVDLAQLNQLEMNFCLAMNFEFYVEDHDLESMYDHYTI